MKLYATVKSERASKGQGGNEKLDITINIEKMPLLHISMGIDKMKNEAFWQVSNIRTKQAREQGRVKLKSQKAKNGVKCAVCGKDCPNGISCCIPL